MAPKLNATAFWLTYSQSRLSKELVLAGLHALGTIKRACVCDETHGDGGSHCHALVEFAKKKTGVSTAHFDMQGEHPNIKVWDRVVQYEQWLVNHWEYCYKEDKAPLTEGAPPSADRKRTRDDCVRECVKVARTEGVISARAKAMELMAADYVKSVNSYDKVFMRECNQTDAIPAHPLSDFPSAPAIPENWRNLFLWGTTGCGKTQFARALLPNAVVVRHASQLAECDFRSGVIFDDFSVRHWPATSIIHLLDWDEGSGINVKYGCVTVPHGTRKVFTYNGDLVAWCPPPPKDDKEGMSHEQFQAVKRRFTLVYEVRVPLYAPVAAAVVAPEWGSSIPE